MPSYYDSTKAKPGIAEIKYKKGGKVKKMAKGGNTPFSKISVKDFTAESVREFIDSGGKDFSRLVAKRVPVKRIGGPAKKSRAIRRSDPEKREAVREAVASGPAKKMRSKMEDLVNKSLKRTSGAAVSGSEMKAFKKAHGLKKGGKVKKMAHGGRTVARGSGAARPQYFGKNG